MCGLVNQLIHFSKGAFSDCFVPWLHCFNPQVTIKVKNNPFFLITQTPFIIIIIITFLLPQFPILSNPPHVRPLREWRVVSLSGAPSSIRIPVWTSSGTLRVLCVGSKYAVRISGPLFLKLHKRKTSLSLIQKSKKSGWACLLDVSYFSSSRFHFLDIVLLGYCFSFYACLVRMCHV